MTLGPFYSGTDTLGFVPPSRHVLLLGCSTDLQHPSPVSLSMIADGDNLVFRQKKARQAGIENEDLLFVQRVTRIKTKQVGRKYFGGVERKNL